MKKILIVAVFLVVFALIFVWRGSVNKVYAPTTDISGDAGTINPDAPVNGIEVKGIVLDIDLEQAKVDGPYIISVQEDNGDEALLVIPSMGILLCPAHKNIADVSTIKKGMYIEAKGSLTAQGDIVPCDSPDHYLRIVKE